MSGLVEYRPGRTLDLGGLPWGAGRLILYSLRNPAATADLVLVLADALAEMRDALGEGSLYHDTVSRVERDLRDAAPDFAATKKD